MAFYILLGAETREFLHKKDVDALIKLAFGYFGIEGRTCAKRYMVKK
jgi:hypothetical protein